MKKLKNIILGCFALSALSLTANAATVTLEDNYIGSKASKVSNDEVYGSHSMYDTNWLEVTRTLENGVTSLLVTVDSNFVEYNSLDSSIGFGDLFLMDGENYQEASSCTGASGYVGCDENSLKDNTRTRHGVVHEVYKSENNWEYAFDLGDTAYESHATAQDGQLYEINQNNYDAAIDTNSTGRKWQAIEVNTGATTTTAVNSLGSWNTLTNNQLQMSFDVTGTSLETSSQIALRWAMTCANDIIEGVVDIATVVKNVSEPTTFMLMFGALAGLFIKRKKSRI